MRYDKPKPYREWFYATARWHRVRKIQLALHPLCAICRKRAATQVDHIVPLEAGGEKYDQDNLRSVCAGCHSRITNAAHNPRKEHADFAKQLETMLGRG